MYVSFDDDDNPEKTKLGEKGEGKLFWGEYIFGELDWNS